LDHHLDGIAIPTDPAVSPEGSRVAFGVSIVDIEGDRYVRTIWMADGDELRRFTAGPDDSTPRFSPDGTRLAFFRKHDGYPQLAVIATDGGEARMLTEFGVGAVGEPVWSPDGETIAVVGTEWTEEWADLDDDERARRPRVVTERNYRTDNLGWRHDRRSHIYLTDAAGAEPSRRLTDRDMDESGPAWSPDGNRIAFISDVSGNPGYQSGAAVLEAAIAGGEVVEVAPTGQWVKLAYRPDGVLHALGSAGPSFPEPAMLWRFDPDPHLVNRDHDRSVASFAAGPPRLIWDGDQALVTLVDSGASGIACIDPDGTAKTVFLEKAVVTGFDQAGGVLAKIVSTIGEPGRLVIERDGGLAEHSDFGGDPLETNRPEHFVVPGEGAELDVWVYLPRGDDPVPLLLNIHGGPASQYGWGFFDEFQVYADAGYGVVATNPRGSAGRDADFLKAVAGEGWGRVDVADIDAVVAAALDRFPRLDPDRLGVMGGSYGGFLTAWLIAHQDRWRTAVVERALLSWPSFGGTSDIGGWFGDSYLGGPDLQWDRSPLRVAHQTTTPTLILHSENDYRCPIEQAEQYFNVLRRQGVVTEFVRFPDEGHELSRSGKPKHREERFEIILDWLARTLA
jgi:dipeptidyl aminopeptidase/acylaminoacyl peptidase